MDFLFNEQQTSLGETVAQVLADAPGLTAPDPTRDADEVVWQALAELGLFALLVPEEHGGVGLPLLDCALAARALGSGLAPPVVASTLVATEVIRRSAGTGLKQNVLPRVATGELRIALAVAESGVGLDCADWQSRLDAGRLTASKIAIMGGADANAFLVAVRRGGAPTLVFVETGGAVPHQALDPSAGLAALDLDAAAVGEDALLTLSAFDELVDLAAAFDAQIAMGLAQRMLEVSVAYAQTRIQFGQAIGAFQAIKHRCADMAVALEAGQVTADYAFWACAEDGADQKRRASTAKAYCSEIARDACRDAIQIHGGMGFTWELGLHRYLRRAKVIEHSLGTPSWHYDRVLRQTLGAALPDAEVRRDAA